jgi:DNA-binding MarR family transcriptional regulator
VTLIIWKADLEERLASCPSYSYLYVMTAADPCLETVVADLTLALGQLLRRLRSEANPSGLNLSQMGALARLEQRGPMTTADLARAEAMKPQSMGSVLASLEQEGLVDRQPHPTDGRQVLFALTQKGMEERRQHSTAKRDWLVAATARLEPAELHTLIAAIPLIRRIGES